MNKYCYLANTICEVIVMNNEKMRNATKREHELTKDQKSKFRQKQQKDLELANELGKRYEEQLQKSRNKYN